MNNLACFVLLLTVGIVGGCGGSGISKPAPSPTTPFVPQAGHVILLVEVNNLVPFTKLTTDLANNQLPNFSFIVPNAEHSAHDCPDGGSSCTDTDKLTAADVWLQTNIQPLLSSTTFQQDGILVIVFDES